MHNWFENSCFKTWRELNSKDNTWWKVWCQGSTTYEWGNYCSVTCVAWYSWYWTSDSFLSVQLCWSKHWAHLSQRTWIVSINPKYYGILRRSILLPKCVEAVSSRLQVAWKIQEETNQNEIKFWKLLCLY